jgi:hypothetical protein
MIRGLKNETLTQKIHPVHTPRNIWYDNNHRDTFLKAFFA